MNYVELYHLALLNKDSNDYGWPNRIGYLARINEEEDKMDISKMSKEDALKAIEDLKKYVEQCEEKEKEIPRMDRRTLPKAQPAIIWPCKKNEESPLWWNDVTAYMTFNEDNTVITWGILAYELAQLMYCREYLKVDVNECLKKCLNDDGAFKLIYDITECKYVTVFNVSHCQVPNERDYVWLFENKDDANRVRDYMNKYVAHVKKEMY